MMDNVSMNENMGSDSPEKKKKKKELRTALIVVFVTLSCIFLLLFFMYKTFVPISWSRFNDKRIEYIEDKLKLDLDNIEPVLSSHHSSGPYRGF